MVRCDMPLSTGRKLWVCSDIDCISVLQSLWPTHTEVDNSTLGANMTSCVNTVLCAETKSLIHAWSPCWVLALFWPMAKRVDVEVYDGWAGQGTFKNQGRWQDVRISNTDFASCFEVPTGQKGQQTALLLQPMLRTQEVSRSLFYHQDIL